MKIGSLVICARPFEPEDWCPSLPEVNEIYTVRGFYSFKDKTGIYLDEIINPPSHFKLVGFKEPCFNIEKFREIQPPMTIEIENIIYETTLQP